MKSLGRNDSPPSSFLLSYHPPSRSISKEVELRNEERKKVVSISYIP